MTKIRGAWGEPDIAGEGPKYSGNPFSPMLKFEPALEAEYLESVDHVGRSWRMVVNVAICGYAALILTLCFVVLQSPPEVSTYSRFVLGVVVIPITAFSTLCAAWPRLYAWSVSASLVAAFVTLVCMLFLRVLYSRHGYDFVPIFMMPALLLGLTVSHIPFPRLLPVVLSGLALGVAVELREFGADIGTLQELGVISIVIVVAMIILRDFEQLLRINWYRERYLNRLACTDPLTGLGNRRHFDASLRSLIRSAPSDGRQLALAVLDIDHFKSYNDRYGHPAGDECLKQVGRYIKSATRRPQDMAARLGGEEFAVVWFDAGQDDATEMGESLRRGIAALKISDAQGRERAITASLGLTQVITPQREDDAETIAVEIMRRADAALYRAKQQGRDRLVVSESLMPPPSRSTGPRPSFETFASSAD